MVEEILKQLQLLKPNNGSGFKCIANDENYYGINQHDEVVFITRSKDRRNTTLQQTKQLVLTKNIQCQLNVGGEIETGNFDIITCLSHEPEHIKTFVEIMRVFSQGSSDLTIIDYFICLKDLFTNKQKVSLKEMQGLYSELYFLHFMKSKGVNLYGLWQSVDRMKFDISLSDTKKIEIKSTVGENRIHKFRHEQLVTDIFDVWIVSILLRKDDKGLSLYDLANIVKNETFDNLKVFAHIEKLLLNYSIDDLQSIKYNQDYTDEHIAIYKAVDVPRFKTNQPEGVSNTEYDSDLNNIQSREIEELIKWINGDNL